MVVPSLPESSTILSICSFDIDSGNLGENVESKRRTLRQFSRNLQKFLLSAVSKGLFCFCLFFSLLFRGPGRRKKNPDIPPELLNNPFKHFKVDHAHSERTANLTPNGESTRTDETNSSISRDSSPNSAANVTFEGSRDLNNNANGGERRESQFKAPFSRHSERVQNITSPQVAANHTSPHIHISPRYATTHVIHSPTNGPSSRMVSPPSGVILAPNSQSCTFSFPPRPLVSMSPHRSALSPQTNGAPLVGGTSAPTATHSPGRSPPVGDAVNGEASVPHVSSTGTSEHAEFRTTATNETGSEMSASSPHVLSREVCNHCYDVEPSWCNGI